MLNLFPFHCCQNFTEESIEFDFEITNSISNSLSLEEQFDKIKTLLKSKICLFIIYSSAVDLVPLNEIKNDKELNNILSEKYFEIYKKSDDNISKTLIKTFSLSNSSLISMILSLNENNNSFKLNDYLIGEEVTMYNIKKLLKAYQYILYNPPKEPEENDPNCCNITFRFVDDSLSFCRRFSKNVKIKELYYLISSKFPKMQYRLFKVFPSSELKEINNSLEQEKLFPSGLIQVLS